MLFIFKRNGGVKYKCEKTSRTNETKLNREVQYKSQLKRMKELLEKAQAARGGEDVGLPKSLFSFPLFLFFFPLPFFCSKTQQTLCVCVCVCVSRGTGVGGGGGGVRACVYACALY
jgi:hypothetical protein